MKLQSASPTKPKLANCMEAGLSSFYQQANHEELQRRIKDLVKHMTLICKLV